MPLYREVGVVLRTQKLGEADRIITLFTRGHGILRAVAKGVRRTSSKFGARLEPFMVADLQCFEGRTLDTITQASTLGSYGAQITADYDRYRAASVIAETAERLGEGDPSEQQLRLVIGALRTLAAGRIPPGLVRDGYLLRALGEAGWTPGLDECVRCGAEGPHTLFAVQLGGVVCEDCKIAGIPRLDPETIGLLTALGAGNWEDVSHGTERAVDQSAGIVAAYTQWHLERGLRALKVGRA
ncbi:DNA repair protein RecO [Leucobacter sp. 1207-22]|uniref:DNA repair protein RecO n=1 Tax=Leucobacter sp. 1207-22 TaxID=2604456 RepID=UPI004062B54D